MSPLDALAPDQRAVVALLLGQGRSYADIAQVLGLPVDAVRVRAHAGLAALAPENGLPGEITAPLADYLLGQQSPADAAATRALLEESAPARTWAAAVAEALAPAAPGGLPEVPGDNGATPAAATEPPSADLTDARAPGDPAAPSARADHADGPAPADPAAPSGGADYAEVPAPSAEPPPPPPSSRLGGAILIAGVVAVLAVVVVLVLRGRDGEEPATAPTAAATATPAPTRGALRITDQIDLRGVGGSGARGRMTVFIQDRQLLFALRARNMPPTGDRAAYAVWFTGPGTRARRLGYTDPVGADRVLAIQGPSDTDLAAFPRLYADYAHVVVSRETDTAARRPARPVLRGPLPRGR
jgi:hypothetical protein